MACSQPASEPFTCIAEPFFVCRSPQRILFQSLFEPFHVTAIFLEALSALLHLPPDRTVSSRIYLKSLSLASASLSHLRLQSTSQRHAPSSFAPLSTATANTRPSSPHVTPCFLQQTVSQHHRSPPELHLTFEIGTRVPFISLLLCWSDHRESLLAAMKSNPNGSTSSLQVG